METDTPICKVCGDTIPEHAFDGPYAHRGYCCWQCGVEAGDD